MFLINPRCACIHSEGYNSCPVCVLSYSFTEQYVASKRDTSDLLATLTQYLKKAFSKMFQLRLKQYLLVRLESSILFYNFEHVHTATPLLSTYAQTIKGIYSIIDSKAWRDFQAQPCALKCLVVSLCSGLYCYTDCNAPKVCTSVLSYWVIHTTPILCIPCLHCIYIYIYIIAIQHTICTNIGTCDNNFLANIYIQVLDMCGHDIVNVVPSVFFH